MLKLLFIAYSLPNQATLFTWEGYQKKQGVCHGGLLLQQMAAMGAAAAAKGLFRVDSFCFKGICFQAGLSFQIC